MTSVGWFFTQCWVLVLNILFTISADVEHTKNLGFWRKTILTSIFWRLNEAKGGICWFLTPEIFWITSLSSSKSLEDAQFAAKICKDASSRSNSGPTEFNEKPLEPFSLGNSENAQKFQVLERSKACGHRSIVEIQRTTTCTWNSWRRSWGRNWKTSPWIRAFLLWPDQRKLWPLALLPRWDDERNDCNFLIQNSMRKEGMYDWPFFHAGAKFHSFWQQNARNNKH